ncbi:nucleoside triphosphate pyrophosphohydrolase [Thermobrachium celere]|uniref:Possible tetrapyrrole methyltransferase domain / Nucleoside triphosphate pyrophosphohydrolase MazG n=1 Tax=Thermobrachium celere DSM 8682 TaxID=941824 RepID=R7RUE5_9CLOT|nr:nucleoside triphosphate pyrophosphohydrolase [Thermobrachium celere]CDF59091.1 possible tetrapyrrole methyltransferase domain / Nucleoside triphosphate pyrophosphohydrolase MazG [Thermobrachium celere DSM 8682]
MITIIGLGPGSFDDLTIKSLNLMKQAKRLYLRTEKHPNVEQIKNMGIKFETFDKYYDESEDFEEVYKRIAEDIVSMEDVVYAVPGHPLVAERSVQLILKYAEEKNIKVEIVPALSFIDAIVNTLKIDPAEGLKIIDALDIERQKPDKRVGNVITQVYNRLVASELKIKLMDYYNDEEEIFVIRAAGVEGLERIEKIPLFMLDRLTWIDYLTSVYIPPKKEGKKDFNDLLDIMEKLRSDEGCPWDREQTHESLKRYLIEEAYEVVDAIDKDDMDELCEELGDVLLQIVFHSQIAREFGEFNIYDVINGICDKMIKRHPHVFGNIEVDSVKEVLDNWQEIKKKEKRIESYFEEMQRIPKSMPSLLRSYKIQEKAKEVGFDWDNVSKAIKKIEEEYKEVLEAVNIGDNNLIEEEIGDLMFAVVNVARFCNINPEMALTKTIEKFIKRFEYIEKTAVSLGKNLKDMSLSEMDELWNQSKNV